MSRTHRAAPYRCGFATTKGSAICTHGRGYHRQRLEAAALAHFRAAMTPPMVSTLTRPVNTHVDAAFRERSQGVEHRKAEMLRLEREAGNPVRVLAEGREVSATVRGLSRRSRRRTGAPSTPRSFPARRRGSSQSGRLVRETPDDDAPTLLVWSDADGISPLGVGRRLTERRPRAELVVIPGVDHMFARDYPDLVVPHVQRHLPASGG